jgi:hypothetical protein
MSAFDDILGRPWDQIVNFLIRPDLLKVFSKIPNYQFQCKDNNGYRSKPDLVNECLNLIKEKNEIIIEAVKEVYLKKKGTTLGESTMDGTNDLSNAKVYDKVQFIEHIFFKNEKTLLDPIRMLPSNNKSFLLNF